MAMKKKKVSKILLFTFIICLGLFVGCGSESSENNETDEKYKAYETAKSYVADELKAPTTAEFASFKDAEVTKIGKDEYQIKSYVNSENGFGAKIKSSFSCRIVVDHEKKEANCYDLTIK